MIMLILTGLVTGLLVGLTGVGGGALMTPLLLLFFGVAPATAIGTDLWFAAITKMAATRMHHSQGLVDWGVVRRLWAGSLPASAITLWLMHLGYLQLELSGIKTIIAIVVVLTAVGILVQKKLNGLGRHLRLSHASGFKKAQPALTVLAGAGLGFLVTLTSIGAGVLGTVLLTYLYPLRLTPVRLVATDISHAIPLTLFAGMGYLLIGQVDFGLLGPMLAGSIPGVVAAAWLSSRLPQNILRSFLALVLLVLGAKLLLPH